MKIVSNNMHVFVIDFVLVPNMRVFALFTGILTRPLQYEWTGMLQLHTGNRQLSAVDSFPALNACTCNGEISYHVPVKNRMSHVHRGCSKLLVPICS